MDHRRFVPRSEEEELAFALAARAAAGGQLPARLSGRAQQFASLAQGFTNQSALARSPFAALTGAPSAAHGANHLGASPLGAPLGGPSHHHNHHNHHNASALAQAAAAHAQLTQGPAPGPGGPGGLSHAQLSALVNAAVAHNAANAAHDHTPPSPTLSAVNMEHIKALAAAGRHDLLPYLAPRPPGAAQLTAAAAAVQAAAANAQPPSSSNTHASSAITNSTLAAAKAAAAAHSAAHAAAAAQQRAAAPVPTPQQQQQQQQQAQQNSAETTTTQLCIPPPGVPVRYYFADCFSMFSPHKLLIRFSSVSDALHGERPID